MKEAVQNISSQSDIKSDPLKHFQLRRWMHYLVLAVLLLVLVWTSDILLNMNIVLELSFVTIPRQHVINPALIIYVSVIVDFLISLFVVLSGLTASVTLKINWYKAHKIFIIISIFTNLMMLYVDSGYFVVFLIRVLSYIFVQLMISRIYSGAVYHLFQSIPNDLIRSQLETEFNNLKAGGSDLLTSNDYISSLYYSHTLP